MDTDLVSRGRRIAKRSKKAAPKMAKGALVKQQKTLRSKSKKKVKRSRVGPTRETHEPSAEGCEDTKTLDDVSADIVSSRAGDPPESSGETALEMGSRLVSRGRRIAKRSKKAAPKMAKGALVKQQKTLRSKSKKKVKKSRVGPTRETYEPSAEGFEDTKTLDDVSAGAVSPRADSKRVYDVERGVVLSGRSPLLLTPAHIVREDALWGKVPMETLYPKGLPSLVRQGLRDDDRTPPTAPDPTNSPGPHQRDDDRTPSPVAAEVEARRTHAELCRKLLKDVEAQLRLGDEGDSSLREVVGGTRQILKDAVRAINKVWSEVAPVKAKSRLGAGITEGEQDKGHAEADPEGLQDDAGAADAPPEAGLVEGKGEDDAPPAVMPPPKAERKRKRARGARAEKKAAAEVTDTAMQPLVAAPITEPTPTPEAAPVVKAEKKSKRTLGKKSEAASEPTSPDRKPKRTQKAKKEAAVENDDAELKPDTTQVAAAEDADTATAEPSRRAAIEKRKAEKAEKAEKKKAKAAAAKAEKMRVAMARKRINTEEPPGKRARSGCK